MNRLLSRTPIINRIIPRRELYIGTSLCWRGGNDKTQYGKPADSWLGLSNKSGRLRTINLWRISTTNISILSYPQGWSRPKQFYFLKSMSERVGSDIQRI